MSVFKLEQQKHQQQQNGLQQQQTNGHVANGHIANGKANGHSQDTEETLIFTSESVGEGHPGKENLEIRLKEIRSYQADSYHHTFFFC